MNRILRNNLKKIKVLSLRAITGITKTLHISNRYLSNKPQNCLIISTTGIGDTIWGTPAIRALKKYMPDLHISVLTNPNGKEILKRNPFVDNIFVFRKGVLKFWYLLSQLRKANFDTVIIFHATDRIIWLLAHLTGAGRIIGSIRHSKEMGFVITHPVNIPVSLHSIYARLLFAKELGAEQDGEQINLFLSDNERKDVSIFLKNMGIKENSLVIGFQPGAAKPYKRWPEKNFIKLGQLLPGTGHDIRIVITGNKKERELSQRIAEKVRGVSLAGRLSLRETAAVIERCNLFVTNDTGLMHIAVAVGTPAIALFSATSDENVKPYDSVKSFKVISKPKPCEKCISKACTEPVCMEQISVEEVFEVAKKHMVKLNM